MGTSAPVTRVVTEPKRTGNPYIVVPAKPAEVPAGTPAGAPAGR